MFRYARILGLWVFFGFTVLLTACGGGGGDSSGPSAPPVIERPLVGTAVKGPLAKAATKVYVLDPAKDDLKGDLVATGFTSDNAEFNGITIKSAASAFLVEVIADAETIDLSTGATPILTSLYGIVTAQQLVDGNAISVSPLTTLAVYIGKLSAPSDTSVEAQVNTIIEQTSIVLTKLAPGQAAEVDIFTTPALIQNQSIASLENTLRHRSALESIGAIVAFLSEKSGSAPDSVLSALAADLTDGHFNGLAKHGSVQALEDVENLISLMDGLPLAGLPIPGTDQDSDPETVDPYTVADIATLLVREAAAFGVAVDTAPLVNGTLKINVQPLVIDSDDDGVSDRTDDLPFDPTETKDTDGDGQGDNSDAFPEDPSEQFDTDGDAVGDNADNCPAAGNPHQTDLDLDGQGNVCDTDDDNDGLSDENETAVGTDPTRSDTDGDSVSDGDEVARELNPLDPDTDSDGIDDGTDAFPKDPSESVDSDADGTGDNADAFPEDPGCTKVTDGNAAGCYATQLRSVGITHITSDATGVVYLYVAQWSVVLRYDGSAMAYLDPIMVRDTESAGAMAYSPNHGRLYLGYPSGDITYIDLTAGSQFTELTLIGLPTAVHGLADVGKFLLAQDETGAWETHYILNSAGILSDSAEWNYYSRVYAWNPVNKRVYFFRDDTSPNDLHYEEIDQTTGLIAEEGETPYHGSYLIAPPISISRDGATVLLGSGDLYDANSLTWLGALGTGLDAAMWLEDNGVVTVTNFSTSARLERRDADMRTVEQRIYPGKVLGMFPQSAGAVLVVEARDKIDFISYAPSDDTDNDGVGNIDDAFPLDRAASVDSDYDGYPDSWNAGATQSDSSTGLTLDAYPTESACWLPEHGDGTVCDFASTMPSFEPDRSLIAADNIVYLLSSENNRVFRWSADTQQFINPIHVGTTGILSPTAPITMTYSQAHNRIYLGYPNGTITFVDLLGALRETRFTGLSFSVRGLASVGNYVLAQDASGAWNTHYIFDQSGTLTDSAEWNYFSEVYVWNRVNSRVYFFDDFSSGSLRYEAISQTTGEITDTGQSPDGTYRTPPIVLSSDGMYVLTGGGNIYAANSLELVGALGTSVTDAVWFSDVVVSAKENLSKTAMQVWDSGTFGLTGQFLDEGKTHAMFAFNNDIIRVFSRNSALELEIVPITDHDGDGLPAWWENLYGLSDANAADADLDSDGDTLLNREEFTRKTLPDNSDSDSDGLTDDAEIATYQTDPLVADSDNDSLSDGEEVLDHGTNPLASDSDGDTLNDASELNTYKTDPLSADTDGDSMNDPIELSNLLDPLVDDSGADADADGLVNIDEFAAGTDPQVSDTDSDGLLDGDEIHAHLTDALLADTDGDRMLDGWEVTNSFNPLNAADGILDADGDGFTNMAEYFLESAPRDAASVPVVQPWATYQGNAKHTGLVPVFLDPNNFSVRWTTVPFGGSTLNPVAAANGSVFVTENSYFGANQRIAALDAANGVTKWTQDYGNIHSIHPPAYANGKVYFQTGGHEDSFLRALDAETGQLIFKSAYTNQWSRYFAPTPFDGGVYVAGGYYGGAFGFDAGSGDQIWFVGTNQYDEWTPAVDDQFVYAYTGEYDPQVTVYDRTTGNVEYSISDPGFDWNGWSMDVAPVLGSYSELVAVNAGRVVSFDLGQRVVRWERKASFSGQPSVALGRIYVINGGALNVLDELTGEAEWAWEPPLSAQLRFNIIVAMNLVFVSDDLNTYAIDLSTRQQVWSYPKGGNLALSNEGVLYIVSGGELIAVNVEQ